ncbi:uncharacterized protein PV07_09550 [Cladophialophora immunda]|uniref:FAD-binding domain-containing protein n=1 Tax=Cladophialophora immunda TaxID=569365 RepID=A0A0D2AMY3_9EURO|nr:uncharacterized protein PV07_09550 [Cladophialophora immunda]KIW26457.1 hypothetical protein PV07_09550 [Cladophialophora immunda]
MRERPFNVVIIGAGIAGLAASIFLAEKGHNVTILEAAPKLAAVGAGIQLPPNSMHVLKRLGVAKLSCWPRSIYLKRWKDGSVVVQTPLQPDIEQRYGEPYLLIHRADIHEVLLDRASKAGVKITLDTYVSIINEAEPSVIIGDGTKLTADLIIGADGLKSHVRKAVLNGQDVSIRFSPSCVYRTLIPASSLRSNPELRPLIDNVDALYWVGPKAHIIAYHISNSTLYNFVLCDSSTPSVGLVPKVVPLSELQARFSDWDPIVRQLIDLVPEPLKWQLAEIEEQPTWVSKSGKVVVIGDASHAMVPHLAQGAAMALEDAAALAECVGRATDQTDLPVLMDHFQDMRRERCYRIQREAWALGDMWHLPDGPDQERRDQHMRQAGHEKWSVSKSENPNRWDDSKFQPFLFGYDAFQEATAYLNWHYAPDRRSIDPQR